MLYLLPNEPVPDNAAQLRELFSLVDRYRVQIASGAMPVYVDGYSPCMDCSFIRVNRVRS